MNEFQFINKIKQKTYKQSSLIKGIGDDAALFREQVDDIVIAKDTFVENVHFSSKTMSPFHTGYRSLAANVSDLAAMGASPLYYLVSIVIPNYYKEDDLLSIYDGMKYLAYQYEMDLIGGDTVSGNNLIITITVIGKVDQYRVRYRHTAEVGDIVFVTGTLGDSRAGLHILQHHLNLQDKAYFINRHRMPNPRVRFTQSIKHIERITLNDVSDGIATEAYEIAKASNKSLILIDEQVPTHPSLRQFKIEQQNEWKYFGGEDFELLGTVSKDDWKNVEKSANELNVPVSRIGTVTSRKEHFVYIERKSQLRPLMKRGYMHLK